MKKNPIGLIGLLDLNGSLLRGDGFHEPYKFNNLVDRDKASDELSGAGDFFVEKLRRMRMMRGSLKNLGMSSILEKFFRRNAGKIY